MISGGNLYNHFFLKALKANHWTVQQIELEQLQLNNKKEAVKKILIVDTLYLTQITPQIAKLKEEWYIILLVHHLESMYPPKNYSRNRYFQQKEQPTLQHFDAFLTTSHFTKDFLRDQQMKQSILVVPPALIYQPVIQKKSTEQISAIMVANLVERKGILPFLQLLHTIDPQKYLGRLQIQLYGTDQIERDYAKTCLNFIEQHSAFKQTIHFHGAQPQASLHRAYQKANLFLSTAFMESFGMALQEAVAYQIPILALDRGNVGHHIEEGKNGFSYQELDSLCQQLVDLVENRNVLKGLIEGASTYTPYVHYTWATAVKQFQDQFLDNCSDYCYI